MRSTVFILLTAAALLISASAGMAQNSGDLVKWSQPPVQIGEHQGSPLFYGFDERSIIGTQWIVADDWLCKTDLPVTDIRWWGSYICWREPTLPEVRPAGFWFGIYTDVPSGVDAPFSHPGELIWSYATTQFTEEFAGYDTFDQTTIVDSAFRYDVSVPADAQFRQQNTQAIYWLSIAAVYENNQPPLLNQWGWKSRPVFFQDTAARQMTLEPGWEPVIENCQQWDMAFELTTIPEWNSLGLAAFGSGIMGLARFARRRRQA